MKPKSLDSAAPNRRIHLAVLIAGTFVLKLLVLLQLKGYPLIQPDAGLDTTAYAQLAARVLAGDWGLGPGLYYVSPLYIYFLVFWLAIVKSYTGVRVIQIALGSTAVGLIFLMAREWFGERAAWIAAVLAAFTGLLTFYEILIIQSSIDVFLTSTGLYALTRALTRYRALGRALTSQAAAKGLRSGFTVTGIIFGLQTLNRPNVLISILGIATVMMALRRVRPAVLLLVGLAIGMSPALIRNVAVAHEWSLVSSHGGLNFYIGNGDGATGFYRTIPGISPTIGGQQEDVLRVAAKALGHDVSDAEASDYFFGLGRSWIASHPLVAARLFVKKLAFVFAAQHIALPHSYPFYAKDTGTLLRFYVVGPWLLIPLGLVGLAFGARRQPVDAFVIWASFVPAYAVAVAIFFIAERYRLPLFVPLAAGSGAAVDLVWRAIEARRVRSLAAPMAAAAALFVAVNWPHELDDGRWLEGVRLAERLVVLQRYAEADDWAKRLDAGRPPRPGAAHYAVGAQLLAVNQPARAVPYLEQAHMDDPNNTVIDYALGRALLATGHADAALPHLSRGFKSGMEVPAGGVDLAQARLTTGDPAGAVAVIRRATPSDTWDSPLWMRFGRLAAEAHAPDVAEPFFHRGVQLAPDSAEAHQQYGLDLLLLGRYDEAARQLTDAVRLNPKDADSLAHLAYCDARLGRNDDARAHAGLALALDPNNQLARQIVGALR